MLNKHIFNSIHNVLSNEYQKCESSPLPKGIALDLELVTIQDNDTEISYFILIW